MKHFLYLIIILLCITFSAGISNAQSSDGIPYQAVARDAAGHLIAGQTISLRITLLQGSISGTMVYQETHSTTTNPLGLFTVYVTQGSTTGTFNPLHWEVLASSGVFMKVEIDASGGTTYVDMGTTQLLSVPFALYAKIAGETPGAVVFKGTWNAKTNSPSLASSTGSKGYYYVVTDAYTNPASNATLNGINDWGTGDWAIFNGSVWQKVDNSESVHGAEDISYTPNGDISSTNVQDAIVEVRDETDTKLSNYISKDNTTSYTPTDNFHPATKKYVDDSGASMQTQVNAKVNRSGDTMTGDLILNADPTAAKGAATKQYVDAGDTGLQTQVNAKVNRAGDTMTGDLILNADPTAAKGAATKQYVDAGDAGLQTQVNAKVNKSGDTMTGNLVLNADPSTALGAATKQYVDVGDAGLQTQVTGKVNRAGDTMTGNLILNADPTATLGAVTKQYADALNTTLQSQVTGKVNRAGDTMTGNLVLNADPTAALGAATKQYVDTHDALKADKVVPATAGNLIVLTATGNLADGGSKSADNISFNPDTNFTATNVQDAIEEMDSQFKDLLDSYIHETEDGISVYLAPGATHKRIGIGDTAPSCPLGVKAQTGDDEKMICFTSTDNSQKWNINLNPTAGDVDGFSIDDASTGVSNSRFFIDHVSQGNVGIGTVTPKEKLHIQGINDGGAVSIMVENTASGHNGWAMGHVDDNSVTAKNGAFSIFEQGSSTSTERMTLLPGGNVGINETLPYATLHVSRPVLDPGSEISLLEGTGILLLGPIGDKNLAFDSHQIQARTGEYIGSTLTILPSPLSVQPLGGDLVIHANSLTSDQVIITNDGRIGIGSITPLEKIQINGAIMVGNTIGSNDGTIRYTGSDFEGRKSGAWVSLTSGGGFTSAGTGMITYNPSNAKVGIGISTPVSALDVTDNSNVLSGDVITSQFQSQGSTSGGTSGSRIGVKIINNGAWGSSAGARDIGLYVSDVSGQSSSHNNLAAVFNGNTVIGDVISSSPTVGTNGHRVLAIQTGTAPSSPAGSALTGTGGIQIYSVDLPGGGSTFHLMSGNGDIIKLYKESALPAPNNGAVSAGYDPSVQNLIINMRDRINALEAKLQAFGLLP